MKIRFLGTGNARGLPVFGSDSPVSSFIRQRPELYRSQSAVLLETQQGDLLLDAGKADVGYQLDHHRLQGICISHFHCDHVLGLVPIKWGKGKRVHTLYPKGAQDYADLLKDPGILDFEAVAVFQQCKLGPFSITALPLLHTVKTLGYAVEFQNQRMAYLCDTCDLPPACIDFLRAFKPDLSIVDCNQAPQQGPGSPHNDIQLVESIRHRAQLHTLYISHIGEGMQAWLNQASNQLPEGIHEARDGLCVDI
jgi:phosphoribosyl 1,2-cyclic phosphate phosphodiesterase